MKLILNIVLCLLVICGCDDNIESINTNEIIESPGTIKKYGEKIEGDCGYYLETDSGLFKPLELDKTFQENGLKVFVKYRKTEEKFLCGDLPQPPHTMEMIRIEIVEIVIKNEVSNNSNFIIENTGTIKKYGEEIEGDCGYYLETDSGLFKPLELDKSFQENGLKVFVKYRKTEEKFLCGDLPQPPHTMEMIRIEIVEIKKE